MAQMVERVLGKDEVTGSIPVSSSILKPRKTAYRAGLRGFKFILPYLYSIYKLPFSAVPAIIILKIYETPFCPFSKLLPFPRLPL